MYRTSGQTGACCGIDRLLDYFHMTGPEMSREVTTLEDAANLLNEKTALILVPVSLEGDWYRTAAGPFLAQDQEGMITAVLPDWRGRYYFRDEGTGRRVYLTRRNCQRFPRAYSAAADFRGDSIGAGALVGRLFRELSWYEGALLLLWGLLAGGLWVLLASQIRSALAAVILTADQLALFWGAGAIVLLVLLEVLLIFSGRQVIRRVAQKGALAVLMALGGRLYAAEELHEADGAAAPLAALRDNGERVMCWLLTALWALLTVVVVLPTLWTRSFAGFVAVLLAGAILCALAAAVFLSQARHIPDGKLERRRREWFSHRTLDFRLGIQRPFPGARVSRWSDGLSWAFLPAAALLLLPVVYFAMVSGHSVARLVQTLLLSLPVLALPLGMLLGSGRAGRSMGEIKALLPLADRRPGGTVELPPMGSFFELKDVAFSYPDRAEPVLRRVNLRLHPGETVGILGATGAGKTTLARLMTGLARPSGGEVYYGGIELGRFNGSALRRRVAYDRGTDILLCDQMPEQRDGRTCVVFSTRAEALTGCDRVLCLRDGVLAGAEQGA